MSKDKKKDLDLEIENKLKNENENIPEGLSPENMKKKIENMSKEEKEKRSNSEDVPVEDKKNKGSKKIAVVTYSLLVAAVVFLAVGINLKSGYFRNITNRNLTVKNTEKNNEDNKKSNDNKENEDNKGGNYSKAYRYFNKMKDSGQNVYYDYTTGIEEDFATNEAEASEERKGTESKLEEHDYTDTNVRTEGVLEGDIVKTDGNYIYEYDDNHEKINIYEVNKGNVEKLSSVKIGNISYGDMYIYEDELILIGSEFNDEYDYDDEYYYGAYEYYHQNEETLIKIFDVSDRKNPKEKYSTSQDGSFYSTRLVDGVLYTFSNKYINIDGIEEDDYKTFVPTADGTVLEEDELIIPGNVYDDTYVVITALNIKDEEIVDKMGALAGRDLLYVSEENIYLTDYVYDWYSFSSGDKTQIIKISYKDGKLEEKARKTIKGYLDDDYCIDEYNNYLRVVVSYYDTITYENKNALYVYDENLEKVGSIRNIAKGETIKSARFMGDWGYFVTFRNTDPLFAVDLSDPENPEITDYLKIPGFSEYMHPYDENHLIGIGYEADENGRTDCIKMSMFDISDPENIKETKKVVFPGYTYATVLYDRNSFMFDNKNKTFGFAIEGEYGSSYVVFKYENDNFEKLIETKISEEENYFYSGSSCTRGIVIDDYLYIIICGEKILVYDKDYNLKE